MLKTEDLGHCLKENGFDFYSGVPCSFLKDLINYAIQECNYVAAANEGDAVATCAGAALTGKKTVMLMQNSGLGNAVSPLTSLNYTFEIPVLIFVSLRGEAGVSDEPQHELMGQITDQLMTTMRVENAILEQDLEKAKAQIAHANSVIESGKSFCFIVRKNTFEKYPLTQSQQAKKIVQKQVITANTEAIGTRTEALRVIQGSHPDNAVLLATTGKTGRELYECDDKENQLYQVGSMGCISALGLGLALSEPSLPVIAIDGDGAALMRLGSWSTTGFYNPDNFCHILLDNEVHDSTGGQDTASRAVDFALCAASMNYSKVVSVTSLEELKATLEQWSKEPELTFIVAKIKSGSPKNLGRPSITPAEVARRLNATIKQNLEGVSL